MTNDMEKTESPVEAAKRNSNYLRGTLAETLASDASHFAEDDAQILKAHGSYQQQDRDRRRAARDAGEEKPYMFMVRCAIPGGTLTAEQYLALDELADRYGNGTLRVTTRQDIQIHGVSKSNLKATIAAINASLVTTLGACGDVNRNVMVCPAPVAGEPRATARRLAVEIARELRPATTAYREIWLNGAKATASGPQEPFYGEQYLPRKFKAAIALDTDNCVEVHAHDCGLIAVVRDGQVRGFNILVGGGMGLTHSRGDTFAKLAEPLGMVRTADALETVRAVAAIFRDHGNRSDRRHARLKYLIAEWGMERFRWEFQRRVSFRLLPPEDVPPPPVHDHLGAHSQGDGRWFYGVFVPNGRIADRPNEALRTALRSVIDAHRPSVILTGQQNLLLGNLTESGLAQVRNALQTGGVRQSEDLSAARRYSMACPALPTCPLAIAESERVLPALLDRIEAELGALGLRDAPLAIRMTGCPNGCTRPYTADVAFVGRRPGTYHIYVGGGLRHDRMAELYAADVPIDAIPEVLRPLLVEWAAHRQPDEGLGDFYRRTAGRSGSRLCLNGDEQPATR
ncbi:MAG: NADPH-dependent assimilatory sulfite reductase hemoprotein subunit [Phycisphaerae bacterium]